MYSDYILYGASLIGLLVVIALLIYLKMSKRNIELYKKIINQDTTVFDAFTTTQSIVDKNSSSIDAFETELITDLGDQSTVTLYDQWFIKEHSFETGGFNLSTLEDKYIIEQEIKGGGMSRIFLVRNAKLGNLWILKYIDNKIGKLANEENILKLLNQINLPQIIDIFQDKNGLYIIQSYIEGVTMDKLFNTEQIISQTMILDWAEQMTQVLKYLHGLKPAPIIHMDLKPSNIMITHDNKLVLIDFGISKRQGLDSDQTIAVTYKYAAPEQLKTKTFGKYDTLINDRFEKLPEERLMWTTDERTDIYSLGVILFEMATGSIPAANNYSALGAILSKEVSKVIYKCIEMDPKDRYQSAIDLIEDIQKIKHVKLSMVRSIMYRRVAVIVTAIIGLSSMSSFAAGLYITNQENLSLLNIDPNTVILSENQRAQISIEKIMANNKSHEIPPDKIKWEYNNKYVQIDGGNIVGVNEGNTEVVGKYRNKAIVLKVEIVKALDGIVEISLRYKKGNTVEVYAGNGSRSSNDGALMGSSFVSPESIDMADDGTIYIGDSQTLRIIGKGIVTSAKFEGFEPSIIRTLGNDAYVLTKPFQSGEQIQYGIIKFNNQGANAVYFNPNGNNTEITDFGFNSQGSILYIEYINDTVGGEFYYLKSFNIANEDAEPIILCELDKGTSALAIDDNDCVYLANVETGSIQYFDIMTNAVSNVTSSNKENGSFIDGKIPIFYKPQRIHYDGNALYVLDYNVLRKITIEDGTPSFTETVAGLVSAESNPETTVGNAEEATFAHSNLMDFTIYEGNILLTDPKKSVIWSIEQDPENVK